MKRDSRLRPLTGLAIAGLLALSDGSGDGSKDGVPDGAAPARDSSALGGRTSVPEVGAHAFSFPAATLTPLERRAFAVGNAFFKENWVSPPASAAGRDGLGPLFNASSCSSCHLRDGRGRPPQPGERAPTGLLLRLGVASATEPAGPDEPHPVYGTQLQEQAVLGAQPEARWRIETSIVRGSYADGGSYELEQPRYVLEGESYGPLSEPRLGARVANQLIGLGLLEAIPAADVLAGEDPRDLDGDGISGRAHQVRELRSGALRLGRFGWKATQPTVEQQVAAAFVHDMGITSSLFPREELGAAQLERIAFEPEAAPELDDHKLARVSFYTQVLAVPAQRGADEPRVIRGRELFGALGCAACHTPQWHTASSGVLPALADQTIHPYTDLLLHDLGPGLADAKRDGSAEPAEWRTPPLWGIGLFEQVSGHTRYLHDGRARDLAEAILWHGGEAQRARDGFAALPAAKRAELLAFLGSL
jgi:CxxC motif-containing protein (DUF1111 family)